MQYQRPQDLSKQPCSQDLGGTDPPKTCAARITSFWSVPCDGDQFTAHYRHCSEASSGSRAWPRGLVRYPERDRSCDGLAARLEEASRFVPLERLAISPQCDFSTSVVGNALSVEDQRAKLAVVARTAEVVWG